MARKKTSSITKKKRSSRVKPKSTSKKKSTAYHVKLPEVKVHAHCNPFALGYAFGILAAVYLLLDSLLVVMGVELAWVGFLQEVMLTYSLSFVGIISGLAEAGIYGLVSGFLIGWLYNKFV